MSDLATDENILEHLKPEQRSLLGEIHECIRAILGEEYEDLLSPTVVASLLRSSTASQEVMAALEGIDGAYPVTKPAWRSFVKRLVAEAEVAQRNISLALTLRKMKTRETELAKLPSEVRRRLARSGKLDAYLDQTLAFEMGALA